MVVKPSPFSCFKLEPVFIVFVKSAYIFNTYV